MGRNGTGLGMAVVWGTIKDHNGYIDVHSIEGEGTTFNLYFPITRENSVKNLPKSVLQELKGKGESILVVDDVKEQREIAYQFLTLLGYTVDTMETIGVAVKKELNKGLN